MVTITSNSIISSSPLSLLCFHSDQHRSLDTANSIAPLCENFNCVTVSVWCVSTAVWDHDDTSHILIDACSCLAAYLTQTVTDSHNK